MITIDQTTLTDLGIELGDATDEFLTHIESQIEERVGAALVELLTDNQVKELLALTEAGDEDATQTWIAANVPDYKDVIQDEVDILLGEIAQSNEAAK